MTELVQQMIYPFSQLHSFTSLNYVSFRTEQSVTIIRFKPNKGRETPKKRGKKEKPQYFSKHFDSFINSHRVQSLIFFRFCTSPGKARQNCKFFFLATPLPAIESSPFNNWNKRFGTARCSNRTAKENSLSIINVIQLAMNGKVKWDKWKFELITLAVIF